MSNCCLGIAIMKTLWSYSKGSSSCHTYLFLFCDEKNLCSWAEEENPAHNCMFHRSYKLCKTSDCNGNKNNPVMVAGAKWSSTLKIARQHSPVAWVLHAYHSEIIHLSFLPMVTEPYSIALRYVCWGSAAAPIQITCIFLLALCTASRLSLSSPHCR